MDFDKETTRHLLAVTRPALLLAPRTFLIDLAAQLARAGIQEAVARNDPEPIFDWMMPRVALQGISDAAAATYTQRTEEITWRAIADGLLPAPSCPKLGSYWSFAGCGYRKDVFRCGAPTHLHDCPLPQHPLRKGALNVAAYALWLFVRDCCDGDFVGWIDRRLAAADPGKQAPGRTRVMREALLEPLCEISGIGAKLWSMILADLLLAGDPGRERWVSVGAAMIAIDSLVHNYLHRTGCLRRCGAEHAYGPCCYKPGRCADLIAILAEAVDAREFHPTFPRIFPRWVQHAIWLFCAEGGWNICNGRKIDDALGCAQRFCPAGLTCDRLPWIGLGESGRTGGA